MISLLDNTVMSNFAVTESFQFLRIALGDEVATSQQALTELETGIRIGKLPDTDFSWLTVWALNEAEVPYYHRFLRMLNAGEAACLAMALKRECRILTDDRDARKFANRLQIPLSGTLGILIRLVDIRFLKLDQADELLASMIEANYRSPVTSLIEIT
jgi:predicted nucleic acid-binding protein